MKILRKFSSDKESSILFSSLLNTVYKVTRAELYVHRFEANQKQ